jgi:ABC-type glycerol-3-phosphate transport system substrate-binding protein/DNA-binding transcriptional regulator YhcF (GntR family)
MNYIKKQKTIYAKEKILEIISAGSPEDQLLPEVALAKQLKVGEITIRRALKLLVNEGYIYRVRGSGTFICDYSQKTQRKKENNIIYSNFFLSEMPIEKETRKHSLQLLIPEDKLNQEVYRKLIEEFENNHLNINVKLNIQASHSQSLSTEDIAQNDIIMTHPYQVSVLARDKLILPLNDFFRDDPSFSLSNINEHILNMTMYNEKVWMLPKGMDIFYICYNKKLFDRAGLDYPDENMDWDKYMEIAKELTIKTNGLISQFGAVPLRDMNYFAPLIWSFGGDFMNEFGKVTLTDSTTMDALKYGIDLTLRHKITQQPLHWHKNHLGQSDLFISDKLAMYMNCSIGKLHQLTDHPNQPWGVAPLPKGISGRFTPACFHGWSLSSESKYPEESFQLIKYLASPQSISTFVDQVNILAPYKRLSLPDTIKNDKQYSSSILTMLDSIRNYPFDATGIPVFAKEFYGMLLDIFYKKQTFTQAVKKNQKEIQTKLNKIKPSKRFI